MKYLHVRCDRRQSLGLAEARTPPECKSGRRTRTLLSQSLLHLVCARHSSEGCDQTCVKLLSNNVAFGMSFLFWALPGADIQWLPFRFMKIFTKEGGISFVVGLCVMCTVRYRPHTADDSKLQAHWLCVCARADCRVCPIVRPHVGITGLPNRFLRGTRRF